MPAPFEALGRMSVTDACVEIIRELEEGDGIGRGTCLDEVRARTERPEVTMHVVLAGMRDATERLMDDGVPGVFNVRNAGWQRMKPADVVEYMRRRERRALAQTAREFRAVEVVKPNMEALGWQDRETVQFTLEKRRRQDEMALRRSSRRRPLPPVEGDQAG